MTKAFLVVMRTEKARGANRCGSFLADGHFLALSSPGENEMALLFLFLQRQQPHHRGCTHRPYLKVITTKGSIPNISDWVFGILEVINFVGIQALII